MHLLEMSVRRRLVGRLERGEEVTRAIRDAAARWGVEEGEVRAQGRIAWVEVTGSGPGVTERIDGPLDVVSLQGRLTLADGEPYVVLAIHALRLSPSLPPVVGRVVSAAAVALDVVVEVWEPVGAPARASASAKPLPAESPRKAAWAKVAEASARRPDPVPPPPDLPTAPPRSGERIDLDEPHPEVGDDVVHPQFGRCRVVESADDKIAIRLASGRVVQLGTSVLRFGAGREEEDRRVFPVEVRVRR